ncbi:uncharacterized protein GGS22DRAFT_175353 [Annulohypoxylon maeteangense]|uniref:uncharacterized protein n=1 Tax=Annulohypoxylon maeteangense TaxID=1927788 RepID=UPI002008B0E2|nr:uncharacterized protein GGS22DRAFT_175353 [Annulohypoxylon maeteangense]KAI0880324.1 hypothetical protein GGS22DRAFT_175353 [Annulohypoxylon maeteangense]
MNIFISTRDTSTAATSRVLWIVVSVCSITGVAIILTLAFVGHTLLRRRRQAAFREFEAARLRDPTLTWEVYARRRRFTHSRLIFEQEMQRSTMIRKSQQSRTFIINKRVGGCGQDIDIKRCEIEEDEVLIKTRRSDDWPLETVCGENKQKLVNNLYSLTTMDMQHTEEGDRRNYSSITTIRLKTPPLLAHPAFRDCDRTFPPRSSSLPTEMTRAKPLPLL